MVYVVPFNDTVIDSFALHSSFCGTLNFSFMLLGKVGGKFVPLYNMNAYGARRGIAPLIINCNTKMEICGWLHALALFLHPPPHKFTLDSFITVSMLLIC
jgi:hypothetical protein